MGPYKVKPVRNQHDEGFSFHVGVSPPNDPDTFVSVSSHPDEEAAHAHVARLNNLDVPGPAIAMPKRKAKAKAKTVRGKK